MRIGEISKKSGLSRDTIRYYEKQGLLKVERTESEFNNYKNYTLGNLHRLQLITRTKKFGFTLKEIAELLELFDSNNANCSLLRKRVNKKVITIEERIQELIEIKSFILYEFRKAELNCLSKREDDNCKFLELNN